MQKQFPLTLFSTNLLSSRNVIQQKTDQFSVGMKLKERELSLKPKDKKKKKRNWQPANSWSTEDSFINQPTHTWILYTVILISESKL